VKAAPENEDWRRKYFDTLRTVEEEKRQFQAIESVLKRLTGRLCIASMGQTTELDDEIKQLQTAIRREAKSEELEKFATSITEAINKLDERSPATQKPSAVAMAPNEPMPQVLVNDERIRSVLSMLLVELRRDPELTIRSDELDGRLAKSMTREQLPDVLSSLTELVGLRIKHIERAKQEVEALLGHMVGKLDEISRFVIEQGNNHTESRASSEALNTQLAGEMKAMGESVDRAADLLQIRTQVRQRLDSIDKYLKDFQQREVSRADAMKARNDQMQARVAELEAEAKRLQTQLQDEQRLATMDALTKVPNRLAYEKRMEEELQRFKRFKQPVCVAVWDVDHFKKVNDTFGHRAGDRVLAAVAESLSSRLRSTDFLARYGGEEFVMLLCGTPIDAALKVMDGMRESISQLKLHFRGTPLSVTISSGVSILNLNDSAASVFERADQALYKAKEAGRNRCTQG
jgi:diguanylate cyclase